MQSGSYVGEDDIVRFEDKYGRWNNPYPNLISRNKYLFLNGLKYNLYSEN